MADTNTDRLGLLRMEEGTHANDWGDYTNVNLSRLDVSGRGFKEIVVTGPQTLGATDITATSTPPEDESFFHWIEFTGTPSATTAITVQAEEMGWCVLNNTDSIINFTPSGGTLTALAVGKSYTLVYVAADTAFTNIGAVPGAFDSVDVTGALTVNGTLTATGTIDVDGGQLKFPATDVPSSNPNTLDDYQEGTWTPTLQDASFSDGEGQTYGVNSGTYTKIGNRVFFDGYITMTSLGTLTTGDVAYIAGLPFTQVSSAVTGGVHFHRGTGLNLPTAGDSVTGEVVANTDYIQLSIWSFTSGIFNMDISHVSASGSFKFSGSYRTA